MIVSDEKRDIERLEHEKHTYCVGCFGCFEPCGKTTIEHYRSFLKENKIQDPWDDLGKPNSKNKRQDIR